MHKGRGLLLALALAASRPLAADLPPVPVPVENPITEPKRVLGKILFWDEQLSSDGTVACGTCHRPSAGGGDPRVGRHPGVDKGTIDDVRGSPGIVSLDREGRPRPSALFGLGAQITPRLAPSNFGGIWADELFWDGRARSKLEDPLTGTVAIERGGALENQALAALLNEAEMAKAGRSWADVAADLTRARPLAFATSLPPDTAAAIANHPTYAALFEAAFGDGTITPVRIAFALATYQRTLVADQTPYDR
ncbi:MAG TPA: cytochrome-c peroxidase, partial [Gammaproteobacteria bacterium]